MITVSARPQDLHGLVEIVRADGEVHTSGVPKLLIWVVELGRGEALEYPGLDTDWTVQSPVAVDEIEDLRRS